MANQKENEGRPELCPLGHPLYFAGEAVICNDCGIEAVTLKAWNDFILAVRAQGVQSLRDAVVGD